jgi:predicted nucleic acid-binding protein
VIVYVESNFLLELALGQEQSSFAEEILGLAESHQVDLTYPAFSISEPFSTLLHRARERDRLASQISAQLTDLRRSTPHQQLLPVLQNVPGALSGIGKEEFDLLEQSVMRLLAVGRSLPTDSGSFTRALTYQRQYDLGPVDAIIYASIVVDLEHQPSQETKAFVSRNWKDFDLPAIREELRKHNCRYEESFEAGVALIRDTVLGV